MCLIFIDVSYSMLVSLLQQLAHVAHIERMLVERCLQYLNNCDVIALVEEVQMADFYVVTERVSKLLGDKDLKTECVQYVKATASETAPSITTLVHMYCALRAEEPFLSLYALQDRFQAHMANIDIV
eukprot:m.177941 g.177941  ORF g.177941 m.177941 type:complete len:127 (+) comp14638_c0_seq1:204-584(+)